VTVPTEEHLNLPTGR